MTENERLITIIKKFEQICIDYATGKDVKYETYESARNSVLAEPLLQPRMPEWIVKNRYGGQFWSFIKSVSPHYQPRRDFIWTSIGELIAFIENGANTPISLSFDEIKTSVSDNRIEAVWRKMQLRKEADPEGAITAARTLLETTLKYILDNIGEKYESRDEISDLYKKLSKKLNLSPEDHNEQIFKQILSGCASIVSGMAAFRNAYGDAHGKGSKNVCPEPRHADLAVNLSGTISTFLLSTFKKYTEKNKKVICEKADQDLKNELDKHLTIFSSLGSEEVTRRENIKPIFKDDNTFVSSTDPINCPVCMHNSLDEITMVDFERGDEGEINSYGISFYLCRICQLEISKSDLETIIK